MSGSFPQTNPSDIPPEVSRLRSGSPLREQLERIVRTGGPFASDLPLLVDALLHNAEWEWRERVAIAVVLGSCREPDTTAPAAAALSKVVENRVPANRKERLLRLIVRPIVLWYAAFAAAVWLLGVLGSLQPDRSLFTTGLVMVSFAVLFARMKLSSRQEADRADILRATAANSLARFRIPESVASYVIGILEGDRRLMDACKLHLLDVLPLLDESHHNGLKRSVVPGLCEICRRWEMELAVAILDALAKVGDSRAVEPVRSLAERSKQPQVRAAAERALPALERRLAENEHR